MANKKTAENDVNVAAESVYTASDLADNHAVFGVNREIVVVALKLAGKAAYTETEARNIINKFKNKEVK